MVYYFKPKTASEEPSCEEGLCVGTIILVDIGIIYSGIVLFCVTNFYILLLNNSTRTL